MDIRLGTNILRNSNGVFLDQGKEQVRIEWAEDTKELTLSMGVFMPTGTEVATLKSNVWEHNPGERFVLTVTAGGVKVEDTTLKTVVMDVQKEDDQFVKIASAKFYTSKGVLSEISPEWWRVGNKMELTGIEMDMEGGGIAFPE